MSDHRFTEVRRLAALPDRPARVPVLLTERQLERIASALDVTATIAGEIVGDMANETEDLVLRAYIVGQLACHFGSDDGGVAA